MVTNITALRNATNFYDIVLFDYNSTNGIFVELFLFVFFVILLMKFLQQYSIEESVLAAGFLSFGIAVFLRSIQLVSFYSVLLLFLLTCIAGAVTYWSKK